MINKIWRAALLFFFALAGAVSTTPALCQVDEEGVAPLGINIGLTTITAACLDQDKIPVPVARLEGNEAYQAYIMDAIATNEDAPVSRGWRAIQNFRGILYYNYMVNIYGHLPDFIGLFVRNLLSPRTANRDDTHGYNIFTEVLQNISSLSRSRLGRSVKITAITTPQLLSFTSSTSLRLAATDFEPTFNFHFCMSKIWTMVAAASTSEYCCSRSRKGISDDATVSGPHIVVINAEQARFEVSIGETIDGGDFLSWSKSISLPHHGSRTALFQNTKEQSLFSQTLRDVTGGALEPEQTTGSPLVNLTIILTGDLSLAQIEEMDSMVQETLPDYQYDLQTADPEFRGAYGAACEAYREMMDPRTIICSYMLPDVPASFLRHDEV